MSKFYDPKFEQDFLRHIPTSLKERYLRYLVLNIGLLANRIDDEREQQFLCFLVSKESLDLVRKEGSVILYNDENLKEEV